MTILKDTAGQTLCVPSGTDPVSSECDTERPRDHFLMCCSQILKPTANINMLLMVSIHLLLIGVFFCNSSKLATFELFTIMNLSSCHSLLKYCLPKCCLAAFLFGKILFVGLYSIISLFSLYKLVLSVSTEI